MDDQEGEMRYMVIETFTKGPRPIYERAAKSPGKGLRPLHTR